MLSIGGLKKSKAPARPTAFREEEEDDEMDVMSQKAAAARKPQPLPQTRLNAPISRVARDQLKAAQEVDASVFEYDEVFDQMKAGQKAAEAKRKADSQQRAPKYVESLLASAVQRKQDRIRAEDVMTARARATEGDEFADKDAFVTPAYLAQQEELRKAEEAEKLKDGKPATVAFRMSAEAKLAGQGVKKGGMASFFSTYLANSSAEHDAAVEAASKGTGASKQTQYDEEPVSDVHLARQAAKATGKLVELNEDGQIVDRTQLLSGGLNILKKPKKVVQGPTIPSDYEEPAPVDEGFAVPIAKRTTHTTQENLAAKAAEDAHYSGLTEAQRRRLQRERQSVLIEQQMVELQEKKRKAEEEQNEREVKKVARRNDETKVEQLKRLAAERRAQKLRDEAASGV
jgi:coiled-coil domain-containing protein 55